MSREDPIKIEGVVVETLSERLYRVEFQNGHRVLAHWPRGAGGVLRVACSVSVGAGERNTQHATRNTQHGARPTLKVGEMVTVEMSPFDFSRGRLVSQKMNL